MKLLFALLGVGFALAAQSSLLPTRTFNANKEYRYRYDGVVSSGLPISQEGSITHLDADVTIQFTSPRSAVMQMKNIRLSASHAISGQDLPKWESLENREVSPEHKKTLEMPVAFSYREGLVSELQFTSEEQHWSANIKRAVLNMLQMNQNQPAEEGEQEFFTTPEKTLEGECDVAYSITQEGGRTIVSKSVNFEKCSRTPEAIYGRRFSKKATDHKVFIPQTVYTYKFDKEELKEISVRSIYEVLLKDEPVMQTEVNARLTLSEVAEIREQLETPTGKPEDIMYSNGYEIDVEKFFKGGEKLVESPFKGFTTKVERATEIVNKLKEMKDSDAEMVHEMARLVRIFRMCSAEELEKIHNQLFKEAPTNTKAIIENALAIAGTKNTVEHILTHIKDNEITPMRAAQLFKSIQETHYPSEEIATMIAEFADSEQARAEPVLRQSAWLCFGSVVRGIIGHREEKHLFDQSSHDLKKKFVDIMEDNLDKAADTYEKILALKTIANSGLTMAIRTLEKTVSDRRQPVIVRVEAIQAMRIMSQHMPRKIHRVLMPIFADRKEETEVRAAAFERIIYTLPDQAIIAQIMNIIERDPNQPLAHFAFTFLKAVDSTEFVAEERMVTDIQMALKRTTFRPKTNYMSFYQHLSLYNKQWLSGIHFNIASVLGKDSIVPKDMAVNLESLVFGRWNQYLGQIGLSHQNIEQLLRKVYDKFERESSVVRGERGQKRVEEAMHMVKSIARKMNISLRKESKETPFAMLYIRYKEMDYAVLPIDDQTLDRALEYVRDGEDKIDLEKLVERLLNGKAEFDFITAGFLFETTIRAPCTLGLPITLTSKMPTVFTSTGKVSTERPTYGGRIRLQGKLSMTSTQVYQMRIWVPLLEHGVKVVRPTRLALPLDMDLEITMKQKLSVNLRMATPEEKQELVQMSAHPIAFLRFPDPQDMNKFIDMEEHTIVIPGWERKMRPIHQKIEIGGVSFSLTGNGYKHWTAKEYFIGEQDYQLSAERTERGPKDVTFSAEIGYYSDVTIEKASLVNREEPRLEGEERLRDLIKEMSQENKKGYSLEIQGTVQTNEKSTFRLVAKTDKSWRYSRINTDLSLPTSDDNTWKWDQQIEVILPRPVKSLDSLKDKQRAAHIVALTKWGSSDKNEILSKAILEQDPELTNWIRSNRKEMSGVEEYELLVKASVLNKMNVASKYALTQESELFFDNIFDLIRGYGFWNSKVARHEGKKNHVNIEMVVEPMTRRCTNITVDTPKIRLIERNLWMPVRIPLIPMVQLSKVSKTSVKNVVSTPAECKVSESKIRSFDNVVYSAPLTKCFSVVAKDCSEKASYAVLVKKASGSSKVLKVVREDSEVVFEVQGGQMRITRDKNPVKAEELEQMNIELVTPKMVVVDLEDVIVRFDGKVVKVQSSPSQMGIQCGLCGHYDGDMSEVFRTANDESTEDIEKFHRSYLLQDGECEVEEDLLNKKKEYRMFEENYENESRSEDYSESD